jgi:hypothetical protein
MTRRYPRSSRTPSSTIPGVLAHGRLDLGGPPASGISP